MHVSYLKWGVAFLALPLLGSCVNDDYDLSDIDTTTRITVNDLTIPVNIDIVTMGDIITFDENSKIQPVTIDGQTFYALTEHGTFGSDPIEIAKVTAPAPTLNPTESWLNIIPDAIPAAQGLPTIGDISYEITPMGNDFTYNAGKVDESIVSLDYVKADISMSISLEGLNVGTVLSKVTFTDIDIQMPLGLEATCSDGSYNPDNGIWHIETLETNDIKATIKLHATGVDFIKAGASIDEQHRFYYDGEFKILRGKVTLSPAATATTQLPQSLHFRASYSVTDLVASSFSGMVNYRLDGMDIAPVSLSDIPDFLNCEGTNLRLDNPQIYLSVNNPVADNSLTCSTGLQLSAIRDNMATLNFTTDDGPFTIGYNHGVAGPYNFVLAPAGSKLTTPAEYSDNLTPVDFTSLSDLLATPEGYPAAGMPGQIGISLVDPQIPASPVTDFKLGRTLAGVEGSYMLVAPLALSANSQIVYTETQDGWNDQDVDAITISKLSLKAIVTNNCPVGAELYAWPIDVNGNRISGVEVKSSHLEANKAEQPIEIVMTGTVTHLDGVIFEARLSGSADDTSLAPDQTIIIKNVRANVSGYYEKEL